MKIPKIMLVVVPTLAILLSVSLPVKAEVSLAAAVASSISQLSCASANFCVAVGSVYDGTSSHALILSKENNSWRANTEVQPTLAHSNAQLNSVSCVSANFCMAVGTYSQPGGKQIPWLVTLSGNSWQEASLGTAAQADITSVSCAAENFCMLAGGVSAGPTSSHARVFLYAGSAWAQATDHALDGLGAISAVRCFASSQCVIAGGTTSLTSSHYSLGFYSSGHWTVDSSMASQESGHLQGISCSNFQACTVLGSSYSPGGRIVAKYSAAGWSILSRSSNSVVGGEHLWQSVACSADACFLAGVSSKIGGNSSTMHATVDKLGAISSTGTFVEPTDTQGSAVGGWPSSNLTTIDCLDSSNDCLAFGSYNNGVHQEVFLAEYDGLRWRTSNPLLAKRTDTLGLQSGLLQPSTTLQARSRNVVISPAYVAFGDSITTGSSIPTCLPNRKESPWGCTAWPTIPYPDRVAKSLGLGHYGQQPTVDRVGIWGYTVQEAAAARRRGKNQEGGWQPQLKAVEGAQQLVTGALGINDLGFSNVTKWLKLYLRPGEDYVTKTAQQIIASRSTDFDQLFSSLRVAKNNGSTVVVTLYYNPYDSNKLSCLLLNDVGGRLVDAIDGELSKRAYALGLRLADLRPAFRGHGAASSQPYVFGSQCRASSAVADWLPQWAGGGGGKQAISVGFDPHPNNAGSATIASEILKTINN